MLDRIRSALAAAPADADSYGPRRDYRTAHADAGLVDLLVENLTDYRAHVQRIGEAALEQAIVRLLAEREIRSLLLPEALPRDWHAAALAAAAGSGIVRVDEAAPNAHGRLEWIESVVTAAALAIAETGTIVLDGGPGQGRRSSTLIPDHHLCIIRPGQVVASVPQAIARLDATRPLTWISGPSATSDIELARVEGVHGPRRLDVLILE